MIVLKDNKRWRAHGESLADVQQWLANTPRLWSCQTSRMSQSHSWDLGVGYEAALELARKGWSDGARDLTSRMSASLPPRDNMHKSAYSVAGEVPDVGRFLSGDPNCMRRRGRDTAHKPIVALAVNIRLRADVKAEQIMNYGAALGCAIDQVESAGRRVELLATFTTVCGGLIMSPAWTVKRAGETLDAGAVAFSIGHPAASRRIGFAMYEHSATPTHSSYGFDHTITEEDLIDPLPGTLMLPGMNQGHDRCKSIDDALLFVRDQINKAAGETLVTVE